MRKIYILVIALFVLSVFLFVTAFLYLDKTKRKTLYYIVNVEGRNIGAIRVDRFVTEEKIIYKSFSDTPMNPLFTECRSRIDLDRKYGLISYARVRLGGRISELIYLDNSRGLVSFVARYRSRFTSVDNIPIKKDTFVFEEESPATYMPIIDNYDFSRGRSQGFNALTCPASPNQSSIWLPPIKRFVTFTSIRDEYLKIDSRKIKAENLLVKIRDYPQGAIWVAKSDHSILKISLPARNLTITRSFHPVTVKARERAVENKGYTSKDISFKNKGLEFSGTLTAPEGGGPFPAVLLIAGAGAHTREYGGFFTSISDYLSRNGFSVLRYDKRGTGLTKAEGSSYTEADEISDAAAALQYLASQQNIDPKRLAIVTHGRGAYYGLAVASENSELAGLILMAPSFYVDGGRGERAKYIGRTAAAAKWSDEYLSLVLRAIKETEERAKKSGGDWVNILGKRCYARQIQEEFGIEPKDIVTKVKAPVLILQGQKDSDVIADTAPAIDRVLAESKNANHSLTYYGYLGHFFGNRISDGVHRTYYEVDKDVLKNIALWLKDVTRAKSQESAPAQKSPETGEAATAETPAPSEKAAK